MQHRKPQCNGDDPPVQDQRADESRQAWTRYRLIGSEGTDTGSEVHLGNATCWWPSPITHGC